jgi:hypothetical protein
MQAATAGVVSYAGGLGISAEAAQSLISAIGATAAGVAIAFADISGIGHDAGKFIDAIKEGAGQIAEGAGSGIPKASDLKNSQTVQNHMNDIVKKGSYKGELSRPYIDANGTNCLLDEIMSSSSPVKDSSLSNGLRWDVNGTFRGSSGTWELVVDLDTNTIVHFNFVK